MRGTRLLVLIAMSCKYEHGSIRDAAIDPDARRDGAVDAPPDAVPPDAFVCTAAGLVCPGAAVAVTCNNACWVKCTGTSPIANQAAAKAACASWGGKLAPIRDATDQACLEFTLFPSQAHWIGFEQPLGAGGVKVGWTWNGDGVAPTYDGWGTGQPNDLDGTESDQENCAFMNTLGDWHDTGCLDGTLYRFSCRHD